ncbi:winged helix-turn-helix domain-containing protein [Natrinema pallidum]|uniref:Transcriptional regulator n=1 Tax=Natrinema pallidum TaxID=69527 RepID=A0A4P9TCH7_9EURY|nr:transcriptional regulator [Natrinema pallidum]QCW02189.1 transcriptional regulator [Natrinema pallidum]
MGDRTGAAIETLEYVARSPTRVRILETLAAEGAVSRDALRAEVDVVRTTLQRNLDGLGERGLLRERGRRYELTSAGALATGAVTKTLDRVDAMVRLRPVLERIPAIELGFDLEGLVDATVVESTTANPYAPTEYRAASLADAEHVRAVLPATAAKPLEASREALESGAVFELLVTESVAETLRTEPSVAETFAAMADAESLAVAVVADEVPFYLGIVDDAVQIGVHDENGLPTALLEATDTRVREWAVDRFEALDRRATAMDGAE